MEGSGVDVRVRREVERAQRLVAGEPDGLDAPRGWPTVALAQKEFGEEPHGRSSALSRPGTGWPALAK